METFTNLPEKINFAINEILSGTDQKILGSRARDLHERYMNREKLKDNSYIQSSSDILAYCGLRAPATYAQIYGSLLQVKDVLTDWRPSTVLDLGCGPGTATWAVSTLWPEISSVTCIDQEQLFINIGKQIALHANLAINIKWIQQKIQDWIETEPSTHYDLIIVANVFNELPALVSERLLNQLRLRSSGVVVIVEPGSSVGYPIVQSLSKTISEHEHLIAPYINNSFVESNDYWIHFPQKFKRPEFQRMIRQSMRESNLMASDWEESKYSYVAFSHTLSARTLWSRSIGPVIKSKGFLNLPLLTEKEVIDIKVMKRHKSEYTFAKNLDWGAAIEKEELIVHQ